MTYLLVFRDGSSSFLFCLDCLHIKIRCRSICQHRPDVKRIEQLLNERDGHLKIPGIAKNANWVTIIGLIRNYPSIN